jgi:hypothetical protein
MNVAASAQKSTLAMPSQYVRAGGVGIVSLSVGSVGLAVSLTALGFMVVRLYG